MLSIDAFLVLIQSSNSSVSISDGENAEKQGNCASSRIAESTISQATKRIDHTERRRGSSRRRWKITCVTEAFSNLCLACSGPMYVKMWCHIWRFLSSKAKIPNAYHPGGERECERLEQSLPIGIIFCFFAVNTWLVWQTALSKHNNIIGIVIVFICPVGLHQTLCLLLAFSCCKDNLYFDCH